MGKLVALCCAVKNGIKLYIQVVVQFNMDIEDSQIELDTKWIDDFESLDEDYKAFYTEDVTYIKFNYIYVNKESDIEKIKEETILLKEPNYISREEIIGILKKNCKSADKTYTVLSILKYNIDVEPTEIYHFLKTEQGDDPFLKSIKNIDAIPLEKSISMFQDLNEIMIIFYEKSEDNKNMLSTKGLNQTKRIYLNTIRGSKKRTYRKTT